MKKTKAKDIFGIFKGKLKRNTDDLLKEVDRDFEKNNSVENLALFSGVLDN